MEELVHLAPGLEDWWWPGWSSVAPHPDADRLSVCQVDAGGELLQVVCGAPTIQVGGFYPFAPAGSTLPGGLVIKAVNIRGVESNGMLCSEAELELGPDADGNHAPGGRVHPGRTAGCRPLGWTTGGWTWRSRQTEATSCPMSAWPGNWPRPARKGLPSPRSRACTRSTGGRTGGGP